MILPVRSNMVVTGCLSCLPDYTFAAHFKSIQALFFTQQSLSDLSKRRIILPFAEFQQTLFHVHKLQRHLIITLAAKRNNSLQIVDALS